MNGKPGTAQLSRRILATVRTHAGPLLIVAVVVFVPLSLLEALGDRALELDWEDLTAFEAGALSVAWLFQVASSLVGEVFYGLIEGDSQSYLAQDPEWTPNYGVGNTFELTHLLTTAGVVGAL